MTKVKTYIPGETKPGLEVSACFIQSDEKCLFLKRHPEKPEGLTWCLPAGKLEKNESPSNAVFREVKEETLISIPKDEIIKIDTYVNLNQKDNYLFHVYYWYTSSIPNVQVPMDELIDYQWFTFEGIQSENLIKGASELFIHLKKDINGLPSSFIRYLHT